MIYKLARPEIVGAHVTLLQRNNLAALPVYLQLEDAQVFKTLVVLTLAFVQSQRDNLDFFVKKRQLVVAT